MSGIPRLPEVVASSVLDLLAKLPPPTVPPVGLLNEPSVVAAVEQIPEGKTGFLKIKYELDQFEKRNELGVAFVHKFNGNAHFQAYAGYDFGERRGAKVTAELVFEWEP
jgi:hypothetical protein